MDLLKQCEIWHENKQYQKIIEAIEALDETAMTPELASELARAYNNAAGANDTAMYEKAIALLKPHEEYFKNDHKWNFRMGYAYYYLDQEGLALHYFRKALAAHPHDPDTESLIEDCEQRLMLPSFNQNFKERCQLGWEQFMANEAKLRSMIDARNQGEEAVKLCYQILLTVFHEIDFALGFHENTYELVLTAGGSRSELFKLLYFRNQAPQEFYEHWTLQIGRSPLDPPIKLSAFDCTLSADEVQVWMQTTNEYAKQPRFELSVYHEKLSTLRENQAYWFVSMLIDQTIGEITSMMLVEELHILSAPLKRPSFTLGELADHLKQLGADLSLDAQTYLDHGYSIYTPKPDEDEKADWRFDIYSGSTCWQEIIDAYLMNDDRLMNEYHWIGAVPGFLCYSLEIFSDEQERGSAILNFRDELSAYLLENAGKDALTLIGGATGLYSGYLDFIAWDLPAVIDCAMEFFNESPIPFAAFHTFRRDVGTIFLKRDQQEIEEADLDDEQVLEDEQRSGFLAFPLLSSANLNEEQLIEDLQSEWGVELVENKQELLIFRSGELEGIVSLMPFPIPSHEAEYNAQNNYLWPEAVEQSAKHQAHLMVAVLDQEGSPIERGLLFTKILAACAKQPNVLGIYSSGTVFEPSMYQRFAQVIHEGELPIYNWVWFGLEPGEEGINAYTYGLKLFGREEIEVLNADASPREMNDFLANITIYLLENDIVLQDGETIGYTADQRLPITRSKGVLLTGMTLKIGFRQKSSGRA